MSQWEQRMEEQAAQFGKFADEVLAVDKQLVMNQRRLKEISENYQKLKTNTVKLDQEIANISSHQESLSRLLTQMVEKNEREVSERKICTVNDQLTDLESQIDKIAESIEAISANKKINAVVQLLGIHSKTLDALMHDAQSLKTSLTK